MLNLHCRVDPSLISHAASRYDIKLNLFIDIFIAWSVELLQICAIRAASLLWADSIFACKNGHTERCQPGLRLHFELHTRKSCTV